MEERSKRILVDFRLQAGNTTLDWTELVFSDDDFGAIHDAFQLLCSDVRAEEYERPAEEARRLRDRARHQRAAEVPEEVRMREAAEAGLGLAERAHTRRTAEDALERARRTTIQVAEGQRLARAEQALLVEQCAHGVDDVQREVDALRRDLLALVAQTTAARTSLRAGLESLATSVRDQIRSLARVFVAQTNRATNASRPCMPYTGNSH
ncbi:hypothetical protein PHYPSEUDO_004919 [Phytophthora pseudosyringae]|uniref:Uncharacterized protein n=1 Tax=Phytophthora pseudosyringae TaxID=221518 RepID=A0A8T1WGE4_9STRA|nr:hypothetical protein PHYPSEUDO_004919 [Phytophthora pseudosyringae]